MEMVVGRVVVEEHPQLGAGDAKPLRDAGRCCEVNGGHELSAQNG